MVVIESVFDVDVVIEEEKLRRERVIGSGRGVLSPMLVGGMRSRLVVMSLVLVVRFGLDIVVLLLLVNFLPTSARRSASVGISNDVTVVKRARSGKNCSNLVWIDDGVVDFVAF